jgi:PQQ-dependent catabolism-associated beta-propeller protein
MLSDNDEVIVVLRARSVRRISKLLAMRSLRGAQGGLFTPLRMTCLIGLLTLGAGCKERPALGGRGDTAESSLGEKRAPSGELAYVTNEDGQNLTVIDTRTDSVVATIPVGTRPRGVKVSPDGRTVYVALSGSPKCPPTMPDEECEKLKADKSKDGIAEVDVASRKVRRVLPGGSDPEQFDISSDGKRLYISNEDAGSASIVDVQKGTIDTTVKVGAEPEGVRISPDGKIVYVTAESDTSIRVLDAATGAVKARIKVDRRPRDVAFTPDGKRAYATAEVGGTVSVIDVPANRVIATIKLPPDAKPMGVRVSPDAQRVYVATGRGGTVEVIDAATNKIVGSIKVGQRPWGIALTPDGKKLYTANGPSNDVSVVDTEKLTVIATVPVGKIPWGVAIGPAPGTEPS